MMPGHLGTIDPMVFMLRVPQSSLKNLKAYAQLLERQGWEALACVTRLSFDYNEAFPKLQFNFVDGLTDTEYDQVTGLAQSDTVAAMLAAPDFDAAVSAQPTNASTATTEQRVRQQAPVLEEVLGTTKSAADVLAAAGVNMQPAARQAAAEVVEKFTGKVETAAKEVGLIELPDGRWYNPTTGHYVEARQAPPAPVQQVDPNILALPDGAFFSRTLNAFVDSNFVGAKPLTETKAAPAKGDAKAELAKAKKTKAPPKEKPAEKPAEKAGGFSFGGGSVTGGVDLAAILGGTAAAAPAQQAAEPQEGVDPADEQEQAAPATHNVVSASADLEALLKSVMPG
jgi:hypothetical protein